MNSTMWFSGIMCCLLSTLIMAESFVVKKEKKRKQPSMNTLKEQYGHESGKLIKHLSKLQKHTAQLQRVLIDDVYGLLDDDKTSNIVNATKDQLEERTRKIEKMLQQIQVCDGQIKEVIPSLK